MGHRLSTVAAGVVAAGALAALAGACTHPGHGHGPTTTTSTTRGTIPVDGWAITGVTQHQICGGAYNPDQPGCRPPTPASDAVTVSRGGAVVARTTSAADGTFRIPVGPGTYTVQSSTNLPSSCEARTVVISGPPVPHEVTLVCSILVP